MSIQKKIEQNDASEVYYMLVSQAENHLEAIKAISGIVEPRYSVLDDEEWNDAN